MKTSIFSNQFQSILLSVLFLFISITPTLALSDQLNSGAGVNENYSEYKGVVVDRKTGSPLPFANLRVEGTNISTVSNSDGQFLIKIANEIVNPKITVSFIGYKYKTITLADVNPEMLRIEMEPTAIELPAISVISKDADLLIQKVMDKKGENYSNEQTQMTAFYRETIKKNRSYVSLSEAVVEIFKQPYLSYKSDIVKLYKARKKADYARLDTVTFKLQGGPFNSLY
ncbi:MAG: carboxypeptidase-like regulatory domain-containing protein, partial [Paludibacter sp.]